MKKGWSSFMDRRVKERLVGATILVVLIVLIVPELLSGPKHPGNASPPPTTGPAEPVRNVTVDLATSKATPGAEAPASSAAAGAASGEVARTATPAMTMPGEGSPRGATPGEGAPGAGAPRGSASGEPDAAVNHRAAPPPTILTLQAQQPARPPLENDTPSPRLAPAAPKSGVAREPVASSAAHHGWAVQLGSFASSANAEKLARQLKGQSFPAYVSSSGAGRSLRYRVRVGPMADRAAAERAIARLSKEGHSAGVVAP